ncbi:MAG TPA: fibronectin type III domain-containing protein [Candidatus Moranbacteria bacterium]|nr:fibronectin type III domain-containing protein [Candidatus Moranbacteria bacterium]
MEYDKQKLSKFFIVGGAVLVVLILAASVIFLGWKIIKENEKKQPEVEISIPENIGEAIVNDVSGVQEIEEEKADFSKGYSHSENYMLKEITFGGYEVDMAGEAKNTPLVISDIKGETVISKDGKQTKLLFTWKTSKLATSIVTYAKNDGPIKNTVEEKGPGLAHALILNFEPSTRYTYSISATDRWDNVANSDKFTTFTSTKSDNIIDVIIEQFKQMFSWVTPARK